MTIINRKAVLEHFRKKFKIKIQKNNKPVNVHKRSTPQPAKKNSLKNTS